MDHFGEQPKFEIRPVIEQKPFEHPAVQSFFFEWCKINDSIEPQMLSRDDWEKRSVKGVLEKRPDGKQTLFIPTDLQLWEMVGVMEAVDRDTFAAKPGRQVEAKEKILELAKVFKNTGTYVAQRLNGITDGREIAEALALEFYEYGQSLIEGKRVEPAPDLGRIASQNLTASETDSVDRFLAGDSLYEARRKRAEQAISKEHSINDERYEIERQRSLRQFFRVAEKAFTLKSQSINGELQKSSIQLKPWQNDAPIHNTFLARIEKGITKKIETPKRELETAIFRRGLEKLTSEMKVGGLEQAVDSFFKNFGLDLQSEQEKLVDALRIPELKVELEKIRQTGYLLEISEKEREIADAIQKAISKFEYEPDSNNPSEMVASRFINCVGASMLGGALLSEAGLNYLVGAVPEHSVLLLVTSSGEVEWRDMLDPSFNERLRDEMIVGRKENGTPLTTRDIFEFSKRPTPEGLRFDLRRDRCKNMLSWLEGGDRMNITVFKSEHGQQIQVLNNTGYALFDLGRSEEAVEAYRQAVALDPKYTDAYYGLGDVLFDLDRSKEAVEAYRKAIALDPKDAYSYYGLGSSLFDLGRSEEAAEAYQKFLDLADKKTDSYWIKMAEWTIGEIKNK